MAQTLLPEPLQTLLRAGQPVGNHHVVLLGLPELDARGQLERIEGGLSIEALEHFQRYSGLDGASLAPALGLSGRTLARRREEGRLQPDESDRLMRVARLFAGVLSLLGGELGEAQRWFVQPQAGLGDRRPLELARTDSGSRLLEQFLGRLEHGIPG